ncbi:MAG TPA: hypothetical protein VJB97_00700 [Candidatus Paceibacterota bacterium]
MELKGAACVITGGANSLGAAVSREPVSRIIVDNLAEQKPAEHLEIWKADDIRRERAV